MFGRLESRPEEVLLVFWSQVTKETLVRRGFCQRSIWALGDQVVSVIQNEEAGMSVVSFESQRGREEEGVRSSQNGATYMQPKRDACIPLILSGGTTPGSLRLHIDE